MARYMCEHTLRPGSMTRDQVCQVAEASQHAGEVRGYRSFLNLTEGKVFCILEAPNREAVAQWFKTMNLPYDSITQVELEGERGTIQDVSNIEHDVLVGI